MFLRDNPDVTPLIRAASLHGFDRLVADLGGDPDELLDRHGIPAEALDEPDALVPLTAHDQMLDRAALDLGVPDLGLRLAATQDLSTLGPLALAIANATDAAEALACASRFLYVHSPALQLQIDDDPLRRRGIIAVTYRKDTRLSPYSVQGTELGLGLFYQVARALIGRDRAARSVHLPHPPAATVATYVDFFGTEQIRFGADVAAICAPRALLDESFGQANPMIRAAAVDHLERHFRDPLLALVPRVQIAITESLRSGSATVAGTARLLHLHPRTLQRRLRAVGHTHADLLDDARRDLVEHYLTRTDLSIGQVALIAGFAESSTLTHACRRWFGVSPRALRATRST